VTCSVPSCTEFWWDPESSCKRCNIWFTLSLIRLVSLVGLGIFMSGILALGLVVGLYIIVSSIRAWQLADFRPSSIGIVPGLDSDDFTTSADFSHPYYYS
jgi:hypothetical protein